VRIAVAVGVNPFDVEDDSGRADASGEIRRANGRLDLRFGAICLPSVTLLDPRIARPRWLGLRLTAAARTDQRERDSGRR
jgi:hypothetical protein